ncbi:MAG TPA: hypothetical protein VME17_17880 [Bryobacteraceae bacterium]|nr:hypothetical protein [Bryobacteraceae bacterium]
MKYSKLRSELCGVVQWLQGGDETGWLGQIDLLADVIFSLKEHMPLMIQDTVIPPDATATCLAMPRLLSMMSAMSGRDRVTALEFGEIALDFLPNCSPWREHSGGAGLPAKREAEELSYSGIYSSVQK